MFNTVSYIKLKFILKVTPKMCIFKNLEKINEKNKKKKKKRTSGNPVTKFNIKNTFWNTNSRYYINIELAVLVSW